MKCTHFLVIAALLFASIPDANAAEEPKVGLVLSGGGAAGIAHIGILKALEELDMPIDIVTGTSMGSLIGALYAIGYTPAQIEEIVTTADWRLLFSDDLKRDFLPLEDKVFEPDFLLSLPYDNMNINLPLGAIAGHQITKLFSWLTAPFHDISDFTELPRPFTAIATNVENGEMVVLDSGFLPLAMRASMSIPSAFTPVEKNGKFLVDGGLVRNLPVANARDLGADFIISVDASADMRDRSKLTGLQDILGQTIAIAIRPNMSEQEQLSDFHLAPELGDLGITSFSEISVLISAGYDATMKFKEELRAIADSLRALKPSYSPPDSIAIMQRVDVREIRVVGLDRLPNEIVLSAFGIEPNSTVSFDQINEGIDRIQAMRYFEKVYYRLEGSGDEERDVVITVTEQQSDRFNLGFRYDNNTRASLLLSLRLRGRILPFSTMRLTARLGEELMFQAQNLTYTNTRPKLAVYSHAEYSLRNYDIFDGESRLANVETSTIVGEVMLGPLYSESVMAGLGYRYELFEQNRMVGIGDWDEDWVRMNLFFGQIMMDGLNSRSFPTKGFLLTARSEWTLPFVEEQIQFSRHFIRLENRTEFGQFSSYIFRLNAGQSFGEDLPLHYHFFLGTEKSFLGYRRHELRDRSHLTLGMAWQYNVYPDIYLTMQTNVGNTYRDIYSPDVIDNMLYGWGLSVGWDSIIGPVSLTYMGSPRNPGIVEIQAGFDF